MKKRKKKPLSTIDLIEKIVAILAGTTTILLYAEHVLKGVSNWLYA